MTTEQPLWKTISAGWDDSIIEELDRRSEIEAVASGVDMDTAKNRIYAEHQKSHGTGTGRANILG